MSTLLVLNNGLQGLQLEDTLNVSSPTWTPNAVYEEDTTQNGTYNSEPAYEGSDYWIFYTGKYWCKAASKTDDYWTANLVSLQIGAFGGDLDNNTAIAIPTENTVNYFGDIQFNQAVSFDEVGCSSIHVVPNLVVNSSTNTLQLDAFGDIAACLSIFVDADCKAAFPSTGNQVKFDYGVLIGASTDTVENSMNYVDNSNNFTTGTRLGVEGNCQTLNSIGQSNSVCQLQTNNIEAIGTSVNADEVIYDDDYVRTSSDSGLSSFMYTADDEIYPEDANSGDLFFRSDRRSLTVYDGSNWLVPTEAFPKYSHNDWDALKLAWGKVLPRYDSVSFAEPKISELSGTWGTYNTASEGVSSGYRWRCAHTLPNGDTVYIPDDEDFVLQIDHLTDTPEYTINCNGKNRIQSTAYFDGCIYGYSEATTEIVKIDLTENTIVECTSNMTETLKGFALYNDLIYACNGDGSKVYVFDPTDNSVATHNSTVNSFTGTSNISLGPDNNLYMLPYRSSEFIVKFDPSDNSFTEIDIDLSISAEDKRWDTFLIGPDGYMYIPPTITGNTEAGFWFNPFTEEWGELDGFTTSVGDAFLMGTVHPSGKLVFAPGNDRDTFLVLDPDTKTTANYDKTASMLEGQKVFQVAGNGNIYGVGRYTSNALDNNTVWKIQLGEPLPVDWNFAASIYMDI